jgi:RNA polymerase sigma-70 factor (ECF subfamily)
VAEIRDQSEDMSRPPATRRSAEFEAIATANLKPLHRHARLLLGEASGAEDLVQETCLLAWRKFAEFTPGTNGRAWMFRILTNLARSEHRRRRRWRIDPDSAELLENRAANRTPEPPRFNTRDLLNAISRLATPFRDVLLLADADELPYRQIAEITGVPIGTVMSRLNRARSKVRADLLTSPLKHSLTNTHFFRE